MRIDAKYFGKAVIRARRFVERKSPVNLGDVTCVLRKGIFDIKADTYAEAGEGIPFIRISDLKNGIIEENSAARITEEAHLKEIATALEFGDIAISKTAYPAAALITIPVCNVSQDVIATKFSDSGKREIIPEYALLFLLSSFGLEIMGAEFQGNVQEHLGLSDAKKLPIPTLSREFQQQTKAVFQSALTLTQRSKAHLTEAEVHLAASVGLGDWFPPEPLTYASSSNSAQSSKRLDAEFFAPRIKDLIGRLGKYGTRIGDVAPARREKFDASLAGSFDYIEISDLGGDGTAASTTLDRADAPSRATWHVHAGDVITSTVRPIRRLSALIEPPQDGFVCSSGFAVLQPEHVIPEVLLTYLRLPLICELMDLHTSASMYPAISEIDLLGIPFAPPDKRTAGAVRDAVVRSRSARTRAGALLDAAKRAVEIAIEQDDGAAIRFLDAAEA